MTGAPEGDWEVPEAAPPRGPSGAAVHAGEDRLPGRPPLVLLAPAAAGLAFLVLPLLGLLVRAPWPTLGTRLMQPQMLDALRLSLVTATLATGLEDQVQLGGGRIVGRDEGDPFPLLQASPGFADQSPAA